MEQKYKWKGMDLFIQKISGHGLGQPILGGPAGARALDQVTSTGPFPPQPICDSVLWYCFSDFCATLHFIFFQTMEVRVFLMLSV